MNERTREIILIAAVAEKNRVIGCGMELPWHIPLDLKRFKRLTLGHPLVMGRRTFEAIVHQFGSVLPGRRHVVLTGQGPLPGYPEIDTAASVEEALHAVRNDPVVYIGGGGTVYEQFLPIATRLELTEVAGDYDGDAFFPEYRHLIGDRFEARAIEAHQGFRFVTYDRVATGEPEDADYSPAR